MADAPTPGPPPPCAACAWHLPDAAGPGWCRRRLTLSRPGADPVYPEADGPCGDFRGGCPLPPRVLLGAAAVGAAEEEEGEDGG